MIHSTLRDQVGHFVARLMAKSSSVSVLMNEAVETTEVIEAVEVIEAAEVPDGRKSTNN